MPAESIGDYWHVGQAYGITIQAGTRTFRTDTTSATPAPPFMIELVNDYISQDNFVLHSYFNLPADGYLVEHISWQLDDYTSRSSRPTA